MKLCLSDALEQGVHILPGDSLNADSAENLEYTLMATGADAGQPETGVDWRAVAGSNAGASRVRGRCSHVRLYIASLARDRGFDDGRVSSTALYSVITFLTTSRPGLALVKTSCLTTYSCYRHRTLLSTV